MSKKNNSTSTMIVVVIAATLGLVASLVLSHEALVLAGNPEAALSCSLNAVVNCATVANHWSASLLGFPNSFIGMAAFSVVITIAVSVLSGAKYPVWFLRAAQGGVILGLLFALWMLYMSLMVIQVLCPWCLLTDAAMIIIFFGFSRYIILSGGWPVSKQWQKKLEKFIAQGYDQLLAYGLIVLLALAVIVKYGADLFQ